MRHRSHNGQPIRPIGLISPIRLIGPIALLALLALVRPAQAQRRPLPLGDSAYASVITCGPGNDFYLAFGHSAIRICDPARGIDYAYNYGTFDFDTPHFYLKFAQGQLNYCLSRTAFGLFVATYDHERRAVWEQRLNLSPQEVNNLYLMLEWNYLPENRYYQYDFFRDNCATRVRDMVESAFGHRTPQYAPCDGKSYRRLVHESAGPCQQWWTLGVDLLLGIRTDGRLGVREAMFHPLRMMETFGQSTAGSADGRQSMVQPAGQHLQDHRMPLHRSFPPLVVFSLMLALTAVMTVKDWWRSWMDRLLFAVAGLAGLFLCFMWFGTDHWCTRWNLNILWLSPLLLLIAIRHRKSPAWGLWLQEGCFALAAVWVAVCGLSAAILPIIIMLALRVACLIPRRPRQPRQRH